VNIGFLVREVIWNCVGCRKLRGKASPWSDRINESQSLHLLWYWYVCPL